MVGQIGVRSSERLGGIVDGACYTMGSVARNGFFSGGKGMSTEVDVTTHKCSNYTGMDCLCHLIFIYLSVSKVFLSILRNINIKGKPGKVK